MAPFDGKYMTSYTKAIVMSAAFLTIYEIFAHRIKCQSLTLKMKVKVPEQKFGTGLVRSYIGD